MQDFFNRFFGNPGGGDDDGDGNLMGEASCFGLGLHRRLSGLHHHQ